MVGGGSDKLGTHAKQLGKRIPNGASQVWTWMSTPVLGWVGMVFASSHCTCCEQEARLPVLVGTGMPRGVDGLRDRGAGVRLGCALLQRGLCSAIVPVTSTLPKLQMLCSWDSKFS